ncbi:hypothetical protein pEaSNUABM12_00191 [Erwinia phage pEa_SNUABM_12]|uniref:Uncharacterized protein n=1 Tax=Erwinia phage pEa_SNUABM_12 TaxID=2768773 RepID=A0A7L8ZM14_9CAUD|nr:hypothetical protein pEaSNUABM12_00191 [Erwinia phage pEa_SNUABM_12]
MIRKDSTEINPYILDEDTRYKVNMTHFTLGEGGLRNMQQRHHDRLAKVKELAESLGVEYTPCLPSPEDIIKKTEMIKVYHENKELYDSVLEQVLSICTAEEVLDFLEKQINSPK